MLLGSIGISFREDCQRRRLYRSLECVCGRSNSILRNGPRLNGERTRVAEGRNDVGLPTIDWGGLAGQAIHKTVQKFAAAIVKLHRKYSSTEYPNMSKSTLYAR